MEGTKREFVELMVRAGVLTFGDFTAKSGRKTPYFVNTGKYRTGEQLRALAGYYADTIEKEFSTFDVLFGPAYKGIPLATATAMVLAERGRKVGFCFNRKETKDHGEGGNLIGADLREGGRVLLIEDVTTAGTSVRETVPLLRAAGAVELVGLVVSVDRQERGSGERGALREIAEDFGLKTASIVTIDEVVAHLREHPVDGRFVIDDETYERIVRYRKDYGGS
jgi:orotate phosphoribosyltransferase